ncbi:MAG: amino acid ABC transporter ATP-binding protein [Eubacteriales bacterium]|nr:amino acid ABC transporter ATP-binding protein [Eubacteriales bacterium]
MVQDNHTDDRTVLRVNGLRKVFDDQTEVLRGIDLTVNRGDVIAILGASGGGKTTLLRCLNFLERADEGTLWFDEKEHDLQHIGRKEIAAIRKHTAFVFQNYNLFLNKTALQNVMEGLITARHQDKKKAEEKARQALAQVGLAERFDFYPNQLSGGQQQRVAIARAMVTDPEIIYFDEPTSALDPELTGEVLEVMRSLAKDGHTMLVVTHEIGFAKNVANRVIFMEQGVVVEEASSKIFFSEPKEQRSREFIQAIANKE